MTLFQHENPFPSPDPTAEQLAARKRWVALLREGKYTKMKSFLASATGKRRCCLGVACDPAVVGVDLGLGEEVSRGIYGDDPAHLVIDGTGTNLPRSARDVLGFTNGSPWVKIPKTMGGFAAGSYVDLAELNDSDENISHRVLADLIEAEYITPHEPPKEEA